MDTGLKIMRRTAFVLSQLLGVALIDALTLAPFSNAQGRGGFRGGQETAPDLITEFDKNGNGRLEADERAAALTDLKNNPRSQGRGKGGKGGRKGRGKGGPRGGESRDIGLNRPTCKLGSGNPGNPCLGQWCRCLKVGGFGKRGGK